jgi:Lipocalin-like domain
MEVTMTRPVMLAVLIASVGSTTLAPNGALAQSADQLVGTWTAVSAENTRPDGARVQPFGPNPRGILTFDSAGRYALQICTAERPKFASNNRLQGTPDEYKAAVHGCNPHWGRYSVADGAIIFKVEHAMFPNWEGAEQKRAFRISGDELTYNVPAASGGGTAELVWRRAK